MKNKRWIALLLVVCMCVSVLAGCGNKTTAEKSDVQGEEGLEYVKLKVISVGDPDEKTADVFLENVNKMLLRDLNCELEIEYYSWADWQTKYPLTFASGEKFDFIYSATWCFYADQALKGGYYELTEEEIQTYMPKTWEAVGAEGFKQTKIDGKIYMIPSSTSGYSDYTVYHVRGDWMAEAGLEDIASAEDMEKYLDAVIANHPEANVVNMNNIKSGIMGTRYAMNMLGDDNDFPMISETHLPMLGGPIATLWVPAIWDYTDSSALKLVDEETADAYYLKVFNKSKELLKKGYWSSDCLSNSTSDEVYYVAGNGATTINGYNPIPKHLEPLAAEVPEADPRTVRFVNSPIYKTPLTNNGISISATSENVERAMMVIEKLGYDQEYFDLLFYGIEGIHYNFDENGALVKVENPEYTWNEPTYMGFQNTTQREVPCAFESHAKLGEWAKENSITPEITYFNFDPAPVETEFAACTALIDQYLPILSTGLAEDVEATYYEWKEALKIAGVDTVLEEYRRQAQAFFDTL